MDASVWLPKFPRLESFEFLEATGASREVPASAGRRGRRRGGRAPIKSSLNWKNASFIFPYEGKTEKENTNVNQFASARDRARARGRRGAGDGRQMLAVGRPVRRQSRRHDIYPRLMAAITFMALYLGRAAVRISLVEKKHLNILAPLYSCDKNRRLV
ncbi:hypothetical protein EVAR_45698_1 [Eumeta japonica]|uniref:Uncharacterized protein n=1 Tax=Eumeta variegata TaxID=151549 RepID=A0A4C1XMN0_EUMVA|nr:hypothetical protein EVAR_45698_1 [Eumeta japonica]